MMMLKKEISASQKKSLPALSPSNTGPSLIIPLSSLKLQVGEGLDSVFIQTCEKLKKSLTYERAETRKEAGVVCLLEGSWELSLVLPQSTCLTLPLGWWVPVRLHY